MTRLKPSGAVAALLLLAACGSPSGPDVRGGGLPSASLAAADRAVAYDAALRSAFNPDSSLVLLVETHLLPRDGSYKTASPTIGDDVVRSLRQEGMVDGTCAPQRPSAMHAPRCEAPLPGYVVRFSEPYQMGRDTLRLFVYAERFRTAAGVGPNGRFDFETGFQLVRQGNRWRVTREARRPTR
jgi:hypothetical protein